MSNIVTKMKNRNKRMTRKEIKEVLQTRTVGEKGKSKSIDFSSRVLPNTIVVDVPSSSMKIGNDTQTIGQITDVYHINDNPEDIRQFVQLLNSYDETQIHKVILDNHDGFKIRSLTEFRDDILKYSKSTLGYDVIVADQLFKDIPDTFHITAVTVLNDHVYCAGYDVNSEYLVLVKFDKQLNIIDTKVYEEYSFYFVGDLKTTKDNEIVAISYIDNEDDFHQQYVFLRFFTDLTLESIIYLNKDVDIVSFDVDGSDCLVYGHTTTAPYRPYIASISDTNDVQEKIIELDTKYNITKFRKVIRVEDTYIALTDCMYLVYLDEYLDVHSIQDILYMITEDDNTDIIPVDFVYDQNDDSFLALCDVLRGNDVPSTLATVRINRDGVVTECVDSTNVIHEAQFNDKDEDGLYVKDINFDLSGYSILVGRPKDDKEESVIIHNDFKTNTIRRHDVSHQHYVASKIFKDGDTYIVGGFKEIYGDPELVPEPHLGAVRLYTPV